MQPMQVLVIDQINSTNQEAQSEDVHNRSLWEYPSSKSPFFILNYREVYLYYIFLYLFHQLKLLRYFD